MRKLERNSRNSRLQPGKSSVPDVILKICERRVALYVSNYPNVPAIKNQSNLHHKAYSKKL